MKLYKISQYSERHYDTYDSAIVVAESAEDAAKIHPEDLNLTWSEEFKSWQRKNKNIDTTYGSWANNIKDVQVTFIGETHLKGPCVLCASFNAG